MVIIGKGELAAAELGLTDIPESAMRGLQFAFKESMTDIKRC